MNIRLLQLFFKASVPILPCAPDLEEVSACHAAVIITSRDGFIQDLKSWHPLEPLIHITQQQAQIMLCHSIPSAQFHKTQLPSPLTRLPPPQITCLASNAVLWRQPFPLPSSPVPCPSAAPYNYSETEHDLHPLFPPDVIMYMRKA